VTIWQDLLFLLVVAVGLVGVLVPVLPGTLLVAGAVVVWALLVGQPAGWVVLAVVLLVLGAGQLVKYLLPGQRLKQAGIPTSTLLLGGLVGVVGFFVVPVVGLPLGFVLGVFLAEVRRLRNAPLDSPSARASTWAAVKAVVLSVAIELTFGLVAAVALVVGAVAT
jgi:uncharacterized protein YqgC (DUF456 family)